MSLVWIKVDREKKIHSIYCDGMVTSEEDSIVANDQSRIAHYKDTFYSVLLGCTGSQHATRFIMKHFGIMFGQRNIYYNIDGKKNVEQELIELFEDIADKYNKQYDTYIDGDFVLSINGHLYILYGYYYSNKWECITTKDNFVCAGTLSNRVPISMAASALLNYDENIDPQKMLDAISKVTTKVNNKLIKIENVEYK